MILKKIATLIILIITLNSQLFAQNISINDLYGKWYFVRGIEGSTIVVDLENPQNTIDYYLKKFKEKKPDLTAEDSIYATNFAKGSSKILVGHYIEFKKNGQYCFPDPLEKRKMIIKKFEFIEHKQQLVVYEKDNTADYDDVSLKNGILTLTRNNGFSKSVYKKR